MRFEIYEGRVGEDALRPEYERSEFGALVRGRYVARLQASSNIVALYPEVADVFPNAGTFNTAVRSLAEIARRAIAPGLRQR